MTGPQLYTAERLLEERLFLQCRRAGPHNVRELQARLANISQRIKCAMKDTTKRPRPEPRIVVRHDPPPIGIRGCDYRAIDDATYEPGGPIGEGATEDEARADLLAQLEDAA